MRDVEVICSFAAIVVSLTFLIGSGIEKDASKSNRLMLSALYSAVLAVFLRIP